MIGSHKTYIQLMQKMPKQQLRLLLLKGHTLTGNRSDEDSPWSLESEKPSVELRAGDKIQYYEHAHVGRRVVAYKISDK